MIRLICLSFILTLFSLPGSAFQAHEKDFSLVSGASTDGGGGGGPRDHLSGDLLIRPLYPNRQVLPETIINLNRVNRINIYGREAVDIHEVFPSLIEGIGVKLPANDIESLELDNGVVLHLEDLTSELPFGEVLFYAGSNL